jgi:uncharacterized protein with HEPN domain
VRNDAQRLADVLAAADAIANHLERGGLTDGLVFDAVRVRLIEIGEAVKAIDPAVLAAEPDVPWQDVAGMRNHLAHRYFDTDHAIVTRSQGRIPRMSWYFTQTAIPPAESLPFRGWVHGGSTGSAANPLTTGYVRVSEVLGLSWSDLDADEPTATERRAGTWRRSGARPAQERRRRGHALPSAGCRRSPPIHSTGQLWSA